MYASILYLIAALRPGFTCYLSFLLVLILIANTSAAFGENWRDVKILDTSGICIMLYFTQYLNIGAMLSSPFDNATIPVSLSSPVSLIFLNLGGFFLNLRSVHLSVNFVILVAIIQLGFFFS
jgi:hypothetical protein